MIELAMGLNFVDVALRRIVDLASLNKDELYPYLIDGYVADVWWDLPKAYRQCLALNIIDWWSVPLAVNRYRYWDDVANEWIEKHAYCLTKAVVRFSIIGDSSVCVPNEYYETDGEWKELGAEPCFSLPCYLVSVMAEGYGHSIVALQVGEVFEEFSSWIFFNYWENDIHPGTTQMPHGTTVKLKHATEVHAGWYAGGNLQEWYIE